MGEAGGGGGVGAGAGRPQLCPPLPAQDTKHCPTQQRSAIGPRASSAWYWLSGRRAGPTPERYAD